MKLSLLPVFSLVGLIACTNKDATDTADTATTDTGADTADSADSADTSDTQETGDTADSGDTADTSDTGDTALPNDADGDGSASDVDCDDADAAIFPGAPETCDGVDNDCDGTVDASPIDGVTAYEDADLDGVGSGAGTLVCAIGEGLSATSGDCDDTNAAAFPGGIEVCDGADNDCDGAVDVGAADAGTFYNDVDADGFGNPDDSVLACAVPVGATTDATDCNDADPTAFPDGTEVCDGVDNDCNGTADDDTAVDAGRWYADADGDGYGSTSFAMACAQPLGTVTDSTDCDDTTAGSYPGAPEACDGVDNSCDATIDESPFDGTTFHADADADGYGDASVSMDACSVPVGYVSDATDCDDATDAAHPGAAETCDSIDNDCDMLVDDADTDRITTRAWTTDFDEDGYTSTGSVLACAEPPGYSLASATPDCDDAVSSTNPDAPEVCGDGVDNDCAGETDACLPAAGTYADTVADASFLGTAFGDRAGISLAAEGDLNGDGYDDLVVGVGGNTVTTPAVGGHGAVYVWYGPVVSTTRPSPALTNADVRINGIGTNDQLGVGAIEIVPDVDGDAKDELVVSAYLADTTISTTSYADAGAVYLFRGGSLPGASGSITTISASTANATWKGSGASSGTNFGDSLGFSLASAGDVNGDGVGDLVIGAFGRGSSDGGEAYVVSGAFTGTTSANVGVLQQVTGATSGTGTYSVGTYDVDYVGYAVAGGDVDGDGFADVFVGAPGEGVGSTAAFASGGSVRPGVVLVNYGSTVVDRDGDGVAGSRFTQLGSSLGPCGTGYACGVDAVLTGVTVGDHFGAALDVADLDGDGYGDLAVAADTQGASDDGAVYLFRGSHGTRWSGTVTTSSAWATISREVVGATAPGVNNEFVGRGGVRGGDFDNDGVEDLFIGVPQNDEGGTGAGAVYALYGGADLGGSMTLGTADAKFRGVHDYDAVGRVGSFGDLDADGYLDLAIGVANYELSASGTPDNNGGVFLFLGDGE